MNRLKNGYLEILNWLDLLNEGKIIPGLDRIKKMMKLLGNPQNKLKIVMIGGTNAKGSTCFSLNSMLTKAGIKSGCFTSPHLHSVRERIRIGESIISIEKFTSILYKIKSFAEDNDIKPTYFEALTAAAYQYFHSEGVDYAIMEIGLGGEWDAVNIGHAKVAILTTLGLDHQDYLGNVIEQIGETKAKIVDEKTTVITGWENRYHHLIPKCKGLYYGESATDWLKLVVNALNLDIKTVVEEVPGRNEKFEEFTLDTAHNPQAIRFTMSKSNDYEKIVIGILSDKDAESMINELPKLSEILICNLTSERALSATKLMKICENKGYQCQKFENVSEAMQYAKGNKTLVTGSFYTVSAAREYLKLDGYSEL